MVFALRFLHIAAAAVWFGHKLLVVPDIRGSLDRQDHAEGLVGRLARAERLGIASGVGTLATGLALALVIGFGVVSPGVYMGLGLVVAAMALGAVVARPASIRLASSVSDGDLHEVRMSGQRLVGVLGVESLLWGLALAAMLW